MTDNADLILYRDGLRYLEGQLEAAMQNLCDAIRLARIARGAIGMDKSSSLSFAS